jgi:hypothetical protein
MTSSENIDGPDRCLVEIQAKTRQEIEAFLATQGKSRVYEGISSLSLNVSADYGDRFLIELIQNAHDAHPASQTDGLIDVHLSTDEGAHGCLYVANGGVGFTAKNFGALTNIALSSKSVNAGAGNKGLGFRSVLHICAWPEIFSKSVGSHQFDGYCFGFADDTELEEIVTAMGSREHLDAVRTTIPRLFLPVPRDPKALLPARFMEPGLATVVRLPLASQSARAAVEKQLSWLRGLDTPLQLFLSRISVIRISQSNGESFELARNVVERHELEGSIVAQVVEVGGTRYFVADAEIDDVIFRKELSASVKERSVPQTWQDWVGPARVSVAVPLDKQLDRGRLYCFLPMGKEAVAPFLGYIDANFYTPIDRRRIHEDCRLNKFFIERAAWVCRHAINFLATSGSSWAPRAVVDLLCWSEAGTAELIRKQFGTSPGAFGGASVAPIRARDGGQGWAPLSRALLWIDDRSCLTADRLVDAAGAVLFLPALGQLRLERLGRFLTSLGVNPSPAKRQIATWVESVAAHLVLHDDDAPTWEQFYADIAGLFQFEAGLLSNRKFLRADDGELFSPDIPHEPGSKVRSAKIFFPPVQAGQDAHADGGMIDVAQLPAVLRRRFAFIDGRIRWVDSARRQTIARRFFEGNRLVREYQTYDVLRSLAEITRDAGAADLTRRAALEWAFRVWSSGRGLASVDTAATNIHVPTRGGWQSAGEAVFGDRWPSKDGGHRLEHFLSQVHQYSETLGKTRSQLLIPFADLDVGFGGEYEWSTFLTDAGVVDCLRPINVLTEDVVVDGYSLAHHIAEKANLDKETRSRWLAALGETENLPNQYTKYRAPSGLWLLPGQQDCGSFDDRLRSEFAVQVLRALPVIDPEAWTLKIARPNRSGAQRNERTWISPLAAFLRDAQWLSVRHGQSKAFARPSHAWFHPSTSIDLTPSFLLVVDPECTRAIERAAGLLEKLRSTAQLRILGDQRDAKSLILRMGAVSADRTFGTRDARRFKEVFAEAWTGWTAGLVGDPGRPFETIPVVVGGEIRPWPSAVASDESSGQVAYVLDEADPLKRHLIEELGVPTFGFEVEAERTIRILEQIAPVRFARSSQLQVHVFADGKSIEPSTSLPLIGSVVGDWLGDVLVCAADKKGGQFFRSTQRTLAELRRAVDRLRLIVARDVNILFDGQPRSLPKMLRGSVLLQHPVFPVLVAQADPGTLTWKGLRQMARGLAEAVGNRTLESAFEVVLTRLHEEMASTALGRPTRHEIAAAIGTEERDVDDTLAAASAMSGRAAQLLLPMAAYCALTEVEERLAGLLRDESGGIDLDDAFSDIATALGVDPPRLHKSIGLAQGLDSIAREFKLDLPRLNAAVRRLGPPYLPIDNRAEHEAVFKGAVAERRTELVQQARAGFLSAFDAGLELSQYVLARELTGLTADPAWAEEYLELSDDAIDAQIASWKETMPAAPVVPPWDQLGSLDERREQNRETLRRFADRFSALVPAWVGTHGKEDSVPLPALWGEALSVKQRVVELARDQGWLDFRQLDDASIGRWLAAAREWPIGMPVTDDLSALGLAKEQVAGIRSTAGLTQQEKRRQRTVVVFAGREVSATDTGFQDLVQAVRENLTGADALLSASEKFAPLSRQAGRTAGSSGTPGAGGTGNRRPPSDDAALSDEQRRAVGLIGELLALEWLRAYYKRRHDHSMPEDAWVSENGRRALGHANVSDLLGYDFRVDLRSTRHYWEVKATTGDQQLIELGPTEIAAAQRYRREGNDRFRIIFVTNVLDPVKARLNVLPNPFSKQGDGLYQVVGGGSVKYRFEIAATAVKIA